MVFPQTPLPITVELGLDGTTWTDVSSDVRASDQISITRGRSDWGQQVDAGRCAFTLGNTDGKYSPRNPESPFYGKVGRNTPVRVSVRAGAPALWLPGGSDGADTAGVASTAALDLTGAGDLDVRLDATVLNWYLADTFLGASSTHGILTELIGRFSASNNQRSWALSSHYGYLRLTWSENGIATQFVVSTEQFTVPASGRLAVRATLDVNNGAGGYTARFYTSDTLGGTWTQLGEPVVGGAVTSIFNGTGNLQVGNAFQGVRYNHPIGYVHGAQVRNGIDGPAIADVDFTAQPLGATSFADTAGRTWLVAGKAEITDRKPRFVGEISSWTPEWDTGGRDVICRVEASGVFRRLSQGAVPVKSPMYREFTSPVRSNIVGYWPMEDAEGATNFASGLDGHPAVTYAGTVVPAAYSDWVASDPLPTIGTGSMRVSVPTYTGTGYVFLRFFAHVPASGVVAEQRLISFTQTGTARVWSLFLNTAGSLSLRAYDNEGVQVLATGFIPLSLNGAAKSVGVELTQSGANIDYTVFAYDIATSTLTTAAGGLHNGTLAGYTVGRVTQIRFGEDGLMNDTALGHLALSDSNSGFNATAGALLAWNGETATARVHRLGFEENILAFSTSPGDERMGAQDRSTVLDLMRSAEAVDEGILDEQRDILGIRLVHRRSLYNQRPVLTLDYSGSDGLVAPLVPVDDDQNVTNDVTVQREGGSSARSTLSTGPLSTQTPPVGIGLYDTSYSLNLFDDTQPPQHAGWLLHRGTWDETRFPQVTVDLANAPGSISGAVLCDVGSRMQILNPPVWLPPDTIDLMVQGYTETFDQTSWTITYNCTSYGPYNVAYEAATPQSLYTHADTDGTVLIEDLTTTETDVDVQVTAGPEWVIAAPSLIPNYDFETSLVNWTGNGATIDRVPTPGIPPFLGSWSMRATPDGVAQYPNVGSDMVPVVVGRSYTFSGWQMCPRSRSVDLNINWFTPGGAYLATNSSTRAMVAGEWTWFQGTATAPVGAGFVNISPTIPDFPPSTDVLYSDMLTLRATVADELPDDFPFDIRVGGEIMRVTACTRSVYDSFGRTVADGWGAADSGQSWAVLATAADYSVAPGVGTTVYSVVNSVRQALVPAPSADIDLYADVTTSATSTGASIVVGPVVRAVDTANHYQLRLEFTTANAIIATLRRTVTNVGTVLATYNVPFAHVPGTYVRTRFQVTGSTLRGRVWSPTGIEPGDWDLTASDTTFTAAANVGMRGFRSTGNTNTNPQARCANFKIVNPQTFTVTRSVNGVVKTHTTGADVRLAYPAIAAL